MKSQYLLTTIIISSLILFVISGASLAFADRPNAVDLTFDKESYEFGDTMYITAQFYEPFQSDEGEKPAYITLQVFGVGMKQFNNVISFDIPENGTMLINFPLNQSNLEVGEFDVYTTVTSFHENNKLNNHPDETSYGLTLSSDVNTTTIKNMDDIKIHDSTLAEHDNSLLSMDLIFDEYDTMMYELQNTVQLQDTVIVSLQSELNTIAELLDDLLNPIPIKDPIGIMPILPQPIIEHPIDVIPITPQRPTISNLSGVLYTNGTAILSWDITENQVNYYKIKYISEDNKIKKYTIKDSTTTSYTVHNLQQEEYDFVLRAWTDAGKTNLAKLTIQP